MPYSIVNDKVVYSPLTEVTTKGNGRIRFFLAGVFLSMIIHTLVSHLLS